MAFWWMKRRRSKHSQTHTHTHTHAHTHTLKHTHTHTLSNTHTHTHTHSHTHAPVMELEDLNTGLSLGFLHMFTPFCIHADLTSHSYWCRLHLYLPSVHFFPLFFCRFVFKGIVHPKMHIQFQDVDIHPRCRWVCFFIGADLKKSIIKSLAHQWSSAVNGCRQNESWESVCNKQIHQEDVFCFKPLLLDQLQVLYPYLVKKKSSQLNQERNTHIIITIYSSKVF